MKGFLTLLLALVVVLTGAINVYAANEVIIDNPYAELVGSWTTGTMTTTKYGADYYYCFISTTNGNSATYRPNIPQTASDWEVYIWFPSGTNRPTQAQHIIHAANGDNIVYVNQQANGGYWYKIGGPYTMNAGTDNYVRITNYGSETTKVVMADGVRFYSAGGGPDTTPPVISSVSANPGSTGATITWITDEPSTSQVEYGETTSYGYATPEDTSLVTNHSVTLSGLSPSTLYHFRVKSKDASNNLAVSGDYTFTTTSATASEFRAVWVNTWNIGFQSASEIDTMIAMTSGANYNVVIPEVRRRGDAHYTSSPLYCPVCNAYHREPKASSVTPQSFDPLAYGVEKAHAAGMQIHPWIVTYRIWGSGAGTPPPDHVWYWHGAGTANDWSMRDSSGGYSDGGNYNLDPGVPAVQDYICKVVLDIVSHYDVDGFNWDYIRYPGTSWGYNPITMQRFYDEYGYWPPTSSSSPNWGTWCDYRRQQVTDLVKKCYLEIMAIKPWINHNVDTVGWMGANPNTNYTGTAQYSSVFQDARKWMQDHIIDTNILMNYKREADSAQAADYDLWTTWLANMQSSTGRHSVDGQACYLNSISNSIHQMQVARNAGIGLCNYDYASTNNESRPRQEFFDAVKANLYQTPVPVPDMPWKSNPTTGIIFGTVTDASKPNDPIYLNWVYKATVTVSGPVTRSTQTDATGTYGFIDLPPGTYTISVTKSGLPSRTYSGQVLSAGEVLREDFDLGTVVVRSPAGVVRSGWNVISLPLEPVDRDPAVIFDGIEIDGNLYRWDNGTKSFIGYDAWNPGLFGSCRRDEGYYLYTSGSREISYEAYSGTSAEYDIAISNAGWAIIGCPYMREKWWAGCEVRKGSETVSMSTACREKGWLSSIGWWWDNTSQSLRTLGLPDDFPESEYLQPWYGYWVQTYVDNLTLTIK